MFVARPEDAASQLARVCREGGRLGLATWLPDSSVADLFAVMRPFLPSPAPGATPPPSPFLWGDPDYLRKLLGGAFDLHFETGIATHWAPDGQSLWELFTTGYGPTRALVDGLDEARRREFHRAFVDFHEGFRTELGLSVPRQYLITIGTRR
jgi:hypothetical protein